MTLVDLLNEFHIMPQFPPNVVRWMEKIPESVSKKDLKGRTDLTDSLIITIDGDDAKDFDDAVSLETLENGNFMLGVHIADVTHYVAENSPLDRAAYARGTSMYLIDTVIPMLPFQLSNELCSLKPGVVRLTISVFMEISPRGEVKNFEICKSFIKSKARMTYQKVTKILEGDKLLREKYASLLPMLENMNKLAKVLNKKRVKEGSVEFVTHESKLILDKNGVPISVEKYPITISNGIIEEFMLAANVTVAKYLTDKNLPCVYRVHEAPDFERVERLAKILPALGVEFKFKPDMKSKDFQLVLDSVSGTEVGEVVSYLMLRSMSRAKYSEKNLGHFGLSFSNYCHFTSPIRRYPDIVVHRILKESMNGKVSENRRAALLETAISAAVSSSTSETNAAEAELRWKDIKKAEYMTKHIGKKYKAVITHVTASGFFAELENTVEGFVAARTIEDDLYLMTENGLSLQGMRTKQSFTVGDKLEIKVVAAEPETAKIDFEVVGRTVLKPQRSKRKKGRTKKKELNREEKKKLKRFKEEYREERQKKQDSRQRIDAEKYIFENAIIYGLMELLQEKRSFKRDEKNFLGVTLRDLAAMVASPVCKGSDSSESKENFKNALISAKKSVKNTIGIICDSFGIVEDTKLENSAAEYVEKALKNLDKALKKEVFSFPKREQEYSQILENTRREKQ